MISVIAMKFAHEQHTLGEAILFKKAFFLIIL